MEDNKKEDKVEDILKERKDKFINLVKTRTNWIFYIILALIVWINWKIRTSPMSKLIDVTTNGYTLGPDLDPFLFLRWAKYIVVHGSMMANDMFRYVPFGFETSTETTLLPYSIAYFHKFLAFFHATPSVEYSSALFPAFASILMAIGFFLLVRRLFREKGEKISNIIAVFSTLFLIVLPSLLTRTVAGIPEKENFFFAMFFAFYFFIAAWQSKSLRNSIIFGVLAGIFTGILGLVWGGVIYAFMTVGIAAFIAFIFNKVEKREILIYSSWIIVTTLMLLVFSTRYNFKDLATSVSSGIAYFVFFILIVDYVLFQTKLKESKLITKIREIKIPEKISSIIVSGLIAVIFASIFISPLFIFSFGEDVLGHLSQPYTDRLSFTVAENKQPFFAGEWTNSFGPVTFGIPLFFWLFFIGSIFLFKELIKNIEVKKRSILIVTYIIFIFALIFSKYSSSGSLDGTNAISKMLYLGGILLFACVLGYIYYKHYKENKLDAFKDLNFAYIFLFVYFVISLLAARSAVRLIMGLAPVASIIACYFVVDRIKAALSSKEDVMKMVSWVVMILVVIASVYTVYTYYQASAYTAKNYIPDRYRQQWQQAMGWIRNNTAEDVVFSHWWDYGYWVQTMGERATVLDGGNAISYWDHLMGRYVLTAQNENQALQFMYTHNSTYLLIDPTDVGKYGAYSSIGSDENYDRYSWISTFLLDEKATQEKRNTTSYYYGGGTLLDEDYSYTDSSGKKIIFPARRAVVGYLVVNRDASGNLLQPSALFVYQNERVEIPLRYLYYNSTMYDFNSGYNGTVFLYPRLMQSSSGGIGIQDVGAGMFLSERNMRALWVRLYLLNQKENFELVHSEPNAIVSMLKAQNKDVGDFVYYGDVEGPIKIWRANFPADIQKNESYLETYWPENIKLAKLV